MEANHVQCCLSTRQRKRCRVSVFPCAVPSAISRAARPCKNTPQCQPTPHDRAVAPHPRNPSKPGAPHPNTGSRHTSRGRPAMAAVRSYSYAPEQTTSNSARGGRGGEGSDRPTPKCPLSTEPRKASAPWAPALLPPSTTHTPFGPGQQIVLWLLRAARGRMPQKLRPKGSGSVCPDVSASTHCRR